MIAFMFILGAFALILWLVVLWQSGRIADLQRWERDAFFNRLELDWRDNKLETLDDPVQRASLKEELERYGYTEPYQCKCKKGVAFLGSDLPASKSMAETLEEAGHYNSPVARGHA